ncbi:hypothetical protein G7054_g10607 [Neopestalotiopsis clavispora]|nr:hypothetical protein G7054_g10607 [Neopestalotiopsis clavispora]
MDSVNTLSRYLSRDHVGLDENVSNKFNQHHSAQAQIPGTTPSFPESFNNLASTSQIKFHQSTRAYQPIEVSRDPESLQHASPRPYSEDTWMSEKQPRPCQTRYKHRSRCRSAEHPDQPVSVCHTFDKAPNPRSFEAHGKGLRLVSSCSVPSLAQIPRILPDPIEPTELSIIDRMRQEGLPPIRPSMLERSSQRKYQFPKTIQYQHRDIQRQTHWQNKDGSATRLDSVKHSMNSDLNHSQNHGARDSHHLLPLPPLQQQSASTKDEDLESSTSKEIHDVASNKQDLQGILELGLDMLTISDVITSERALKSDASKAHDTENVVSPSRPQSRGSSICLEEALSGTSDPPPYLETAQRRQLFIQELMASVTNLFRAIPIPLSEAARENAPASSNQTYNNDTPSRTGNGRTQSGHCSRQPIPRKKRKLSQQSNGEDSDDEGQAQPETPIDKPTEDGQLFGCPYHKHDMSQSSQTTVCSGGCWRSVARVKAHVYAKHKQAIHCPRCRTIFDDKTTLNLHLQQQTPCDPSGEANIEGFNDDQEGQLRSRKGLSKMTEYDKWRKMYKILFPHVAETEIPSPWRIADTLTKKLKTKFPAYDQLHIEGHDLTEALDEALNTSPPSTRNTGRAGDSFGTETGDLPILPDSQPEAFVFGSTSDMGAFVNQSEGSYSWWAEAPGRPTSFPDPNTISSSSARGPRLDYMTEGAHLRQRSSATQQTSDSGYGSREDQQSQTLRWEDVEYSY